MPVPLKMENFEEKLSRQSLRQIPGEWRAEIISAMERALCPAPRASLLSTINHQLSTLLWPHPKAWAGLAAVWLCILALNFSTRDKSPVMAEKFSPPSPAMMAELKKQQRLFAELLGANEPRVADRQKTFPKPRSEWTELLTA